MPSLSSSTTAMSHIDQHAFEHLERPKSPTFSMDTSTPPFPYVDAYPGFDYLQFPPHSPFNVANVPRKFPFLYYKSVSAGIDLKIDLDSFPPITPEWCIIHYSSCWFVPPHFFRVSQHRRRPPRLCLFFWCLVHYRLSRTPIHSPRQCLPACSHSP